MSQASDQPEDLPLSQESLPLSQESNQSADLTYSVPEKVSKRQTVSVPELMAIDRIGISNRGISRYIKRGNKGMLINLAVKLTTN